MDVRHLHRDAIDDDPFLAAGVDEQQALLPVVEEPEVSQRVPALCVERSLHRGRACRNGRDAIPFERFHAGVRHERAQALEGLRGNAPAVSQTRNQFAVVDRGASEGRLGHRLRPHWQFITVEKAYARETALPGYVSTISGPTRRVGRFVGDCPILVEVQPNPRICELFALPHPDTSKMFTDRRIRSQPEIGLLDHLVLAHFRRCSGAGDPAVFKDIDVIGELEAVVGVLLDEDDRLPALGQAAKN